MIGVIFDFATGVVEVRIDGNNCLFRSQQSYNAFYPIDGLRLDKKGVIKEHPDLKDSNEWRQEAIKRFKEKLKTFDTEMDRINYIMEDLKKFGYKPLYIQKQGGRARKLN